MAKQKLCNGNYAAIDIGSNAVRLLIKHIGFTEEGMYGTKEQLIRVPLRLGFDAFTKDKISRRKAKKLTDLIHAYAQIMKLYEVLNYKACATSAIRDAANGKKLIASIKKKTGVRIHILSGKEEAELIYNTHADFLQNVDGNFMYVDVGGGSTEINTVINGVLISSNSYNIGTIRVLSDTVDPEEWRRLENDLSELNHLYSPIDILGSGGNINKLYRLVDKRDKILQRMSVSSLSDIYNRMTQMSLEERVKEYRLKYDRAEVIVPASHVFLTIARLINAHYIYVPTIGLVDGIIDEMLQKKRNKLALKAGVGMTDEMNQTEEDYESEIVNKRINKKIEEMIEDHTKKQE